MRKKERYEKILAWFRENVPVAETELHYDNPFELLIAVILSAQCTDKRVNMITPALTGTSLLPKHSPLLLPTWYTSISAACPIPTTRPSPL